MTCCADVSEYSKYHSASYLVYLDKGTVQHVKYDGWKQIYTQLTPERVHVSLERGEMTCRGNANLLRLRHWLLSFISDVC